MRRKLELSPLRCLLLQTSLIITEMLKDRVPTLPSVLSSSVQASELTNLTED